MPHGGWSLIVTRFPGDKNLCTVPLLRCREPWAVALRPLALRGEAQDLAAEILSGLSRELALEYQAALAELHISSELRASEDVGEVVHRASEFAIQHPETVGRGFSLVDGCVVVGSPYSFHAYFRRANQGQEARPRWQVERGYNHEHPASSARLPREQLRLEVSAARDTAQALARAFPDSDFAVCVGLGANIISFYQLGDGAPEEDLPSRTPSPFRADCSACHRAQEYVLRAAPDPEFPEVAWGECRQCGTELVISGPDAVLLVRHGLVESRWS